jgi:hypothetical protein
MKDDRVALDCILDGLGIKTPGSRDLLTPGIRGYLHGVDITGAPPHTKGETLEHFKDVVERSRAKGAKLD